MVMKSRQTLLLLWTTLLCACAQNTQLGKPPSDAEIAACEASGGSIQPFYAFHEWVCYPNPEAQSPPAPPAQSQ